MSDEDDTNVVQFPKKSGAAASPPEGDEGVASPPEVEREWTPEEIAQAQAQAYELEVRQIVGVVRPFVEEHIEPPQLREIIDSVLQEQLEIFQQIWPTFFGEAAETSPSFHICVWGPEATGPTDESHMHRFIAPKQIKGTAVQPGAGFGLTLGFLLSPPARVVLRAFGYRYRFEQSTIDCWADDKPKIILPH